MLTDESPLADGPRCAVGNTMNNPPGGPNTFGGTSLLQAPISLRSSTMATNSVTGPGSKEVAEDRTGS